MAKKKKPQNKEPNIFVVAILVVFIVTTVWTVLRYTQDSLEIKNKVNAEQQASLEFKSKGINTEPINIRKLDTNITYKIGAISHHLVGAYLTSDIADFGDQRQNYQIGTKNKFLVVQDLVDNTKENSPKVEALVNKYLSLRDGNTIYKPVSLDTLEVGPLDSITAYIVFVVPMEKNKFNLVSGLGSQSKVTPLDFVSPQVQSLDGVFLLNAGYAPTFPQ